MFRANVTLVLVVVAGGLSGCVLTQRASPVSQVDASPGDRLCLVDNPLARNDFGESLAMELADRGLDVLRIGVGASARDCPLTATYRAEWGVDLFTYLTFAEITVRRGEVMVGTAAYDGRAGAWNVGKFVQAKDKIPELVSALFPRGALADGASNEALSAP